MSDVESKQHVLAYRPLKSAVKPMREQICALDFETRGLGGEPLCASYAILDRDGKLADSGILTGPDHTARLLDLIIDAGPGKLWYAHNAQYDWRYLFDLILDRRDGLRPEFSLRTDTDVYQIVLKPFADEKQTIILRDSQALWPGSLADLTKNFAPDHAKLTGAIDFSGGEIFDPCNQAHLDYAVRDSEALALAMYNLNVKLGELYGINMGHTSAGTAMRAWKRTIRRTYYVHAPSMEFCRRAYYGGIVFLTDTNPHENVVSYDINSSYPAVMKNRGVPYGTPVRTWQFKGEYPGIYHCRITCPDDLRIPIIPYRDHRGVTRWVTGRIETVCTNEEILFALAHGYTDLEIIHGEFWREYIYPFTEFVEKAEKIRAEYKGTPAEALVKLIQNSLYGRFGTRQERRRVFIPESNEETIGAEPLDHRDILWSKKEFDPTVVTNPLWAAFITAWGRLAILRTVYDEVGVENVLYGDTDSLTVKSGTDTSKMRIGHEYGAYKKDKEWSVFRALAPKVYAGKFATGKKAGQWGGACKGIPIDSKNNFFEELFNEKIVTREYDTLQSFWVGVKKGFVPAQIVHRVSTDIENSGSWALNEDGTIRPKRIDE